LNTVGSPTSVDAGIAAGCSKRPFSKAAVDESTLGYVEDAFEARTLLADFFSILLLTVSWTEKQDVKPDRQP
jgi:hypothetical protein